MLREDLASHVPRSHYTDRTSAINAILSIMKAFKYVRFSATLTLPVYTW